jgi:hypothetical protein
VRDFVKAIHKPSSFITYCGCESVLGGEIASELANVRGDEIMVTTKKHSLILMLQKSELVHEA